MRRFVLSALLALAVTACAAGTATPTPRQAEAPTAVTPAPTFTPALLPTQPPTATATPPPAARQLTTGGCCVQPFWSPNGEQVWFIDRPSEAQPSGIWGVDAVAGGEHQFITGRLGIYSADRTLVAYPEGGQTYIERTGGERWVAPSEGRAISFSPDGTQIAWQIESSPANFDQRLVEIWLANVDGNGARRVAQLGGGGFSGWFPDSARLLISGREEPEADPFLAALTLSDGGLTPIAQSKRLRGSSISPGGGWVAYQVTFSGDPAQDGLWVARFDGSESRKLDIFGAYRWRAEGRLLVIPLDMNAGGQRFVEVEVSTGEMRALTDPALTPIHIAGGDWSLSPDGHRVAFVSADDHNIWVLELPR